MKYLTALIFLISCQSLRAQSLYQDSLYKKGKTSTMAINSNFTIAKPVNHWIAFTKVFPHINDNDWTDAWVSGNSPDGLMWKYHFASDTLYVDTTKIKHIIYLK